MANNDISALRDILFESLRALKKGASSEEIALAKARSEIAQTIINSAKIEVDYIRATGENGTGFISYKPAETQFQPATESFAVLPKGLPAGVTRHICK